MRRSLVIAAALLALAAGAVPANAAPMGVDAPATVVFGPHFAGRSVMYGSAGSERLFDPRTHRSARLAEVPLPGRTHTSGRVVAATCCFQTDRAVSSLAVSGTRAAWIDDSYAIDPSFDGTQIVSAYSAVLRSGRSDAFLGYSGAYIGADQPATCSPIAGTPRTPRALALEQDTAVVLGEVVDCSSGRPVATGRSRVELYDLVNGGPPQTVFEAADAQLELSAPSIAGTFVAWVEHDSGGLRIAVFDRALAAVAYRAQLPPDCGPIALALEADGRVAASCGPARPALWFSPADPSAHPLPAGTVLAFASGRALLDRRVGGMRRLDLASADGSVRRVASFTAASSAGGADFDGSYVTWAVRRHVRRLVLRCRGRSKRCRRKVRRTVAVDRVLVERAPG